MPEAAANPFFGNKHRRLAQSCWVAMAKCLEAIFVVIQMINRRFQ
jgi:DNA-directed RNA polymerase